MIYPKDFESKIGFDTIRKYLKEKCISDMARREVDAMEFSSNFEAVKTLLVLTDEMASIVREHLELPLDNVHDVMADLSRIKAVGSYMSAETLHRLALMLDSVGKVKAFLASHVGENGLPRFMALQQLMSSAESFPEVASRILQAVNKYGEVKDTASPRLMEVREELRRQQGAVQRAMKRVLEKAVAAGVVDRDTTPAVRDGRLVIPVAAANKRSINGIVHDESATGRTFFIEPAEVVASGNKLRELELDERREVIAVLVALTDMLRPLAAAIADSVAALGRLDFIHAKALFAIDLQASMPHLHDKSELEWYHAVHPALELSLRQHGKSVVALNLRLDSRHRILIISGPNAGGKSVTLKTVATVQYMLQCGLLPTLYSNSHMGIFESIFIDIGDEQSFENNLSTYSSHLKNMRFFLTHANASTLILADEMGSGTEPQIGGAIAQAILKQLGNDKCYGIVTTHYQNLKTFADAEEGFVNGAMLYDRQHLQPTFELSVGSAGSSFALDIAQKVGLPHQVIADAKEIAGSDMVNLDKYLSEITRDRRYWAQKRQSIKEKESKLESLVDQYETSVDDLTRQRGQILKQARQDAGEILKDVNARIERTILEIRNTQAEKQRTKEVRQELADYTRDVRAQDSDSQLPGVKRLKRHDKRKTPRAETSTAAQPSQLSPGDYVRMSDGGVVGNIISLKGKKAEVAFGALRTFVDLDKLKPAQKPRQGISEQVSTVTRQTEESSRQRQLNFSTQLDVRGMRGDEAVQALNYFMDDVVQFDADRVRILHGTGHGILKTLIRQQLDANPHVKSYRDEDVRFGGAGITVVEL